MAARKITQITVYWDRSQDNQGWAYRASDRAGDAATGPLESDTLEHAIASACWRMDMTGIEPDFALCQEEGGYATWTASEDA